LTVLLCFAKIVWKICVKKYKEFNGVNFSSTTVRMKVLASLKANDSSSHEFAFWWRDNKSWHVNITSFRLRSRISVPLLFRIALRC